MPMKFAKPALMLAMLLTLPGCVTAMGSSGTETGKAICDQFRPLRWSDKDTDETIRQAKANNAVGKAICGWGK